MKFVWGALAGAVGVVIVLKLTIPAAGSGQGPSPSICGGSGCLGPLLIAGPVAGLLFGGLAGGLGVAAGEVAAVGFLLKGVAM